MTDSLCAFAREVETTDTSRRKTARR
jgi:hypothetical protein